MSNYLNIINKGFKRVDVRTMLMSVFSLILVSCVSNSLGETDNGAAAAATPQSDFFSWANSDWLEKTEIPSDKPGVNNFIQIQQRVNNDLIKLFSSLADKEDESREESSIAILYDAFIDTEARNSLGINPIIEDLNSIESIRTYQEVAHQFSRFKKIGIAAPYTISTMTDFKDSTRYLPVVVQAGLGIEKDNYEGDDERS